MGVDDYEMQFHDEKCLFNASLEMFLRVIMPRLYKLNNRLNMLLKSTNGVSVNVITTTKTTTITGKAGDQRDDSEDKLIGEDDNSDYQFYTYPWENVYHNDGNKQNRPENSIKNGNRGVSAVANDRQHFNRGRNNSKITKSLSSSGHNKTPSSPSATPENTPFSLLKLVAGRLCPDIIQLWHVSCSCFSMLWFDC